MYGENHDEGYQKATEAVCAIGTNGIPALMEWIRYETPAWKKRLHAASDAGRLPRWLANTPPVRAVIDDDAALERSLNALLALVSLGPKAAPAVPELVQLLMLTNCPNQVGFASLLETIEAAATPALAIELRKPEVVANYDVMEAVIVICHSTEPGPLLPVLAQHLSSTNFDAALNSALALASPRRYYADLAVPALIQGLRDRRHHSPSQDPGERHVYPLKDEIPICLAEYGALARDGLPVLSNALSDEDPYYRTLVTNAIEGITQDIRTGAH
jgi:hypothetical protein